MHFKNYTNERFNMPEKQYDFSYPGGQHQSMNELEAWPSVAKMHGIYDDDIQQIEQRL